jgi:hypothetical protein
MFEPKKQLSARLCARGLRTAITDAKNHFDLSLIALLFSYYKTGSLRLFIFRTVLFLLLHFWESLLHLFQMPHKMPN